jgi:hypothetical protein
MYTLQQTKRVLEFNTLLLLLGYKRRLVKGLPL